MRKTIFFLSLVVLCLSAGYLFRHQLLVVGTKRALNQAFPHSIVYKEMKAKEGKISIAELHGHQKNTFLTLSGVEFSLNFSELLKHPKPVINLLKSKKTNWIQIVAQLKQYGVDLNIEQGILQLDNFRYFFQVKKGEKKHEIATVTISHDPNLLQNPFIVIQFHIRSDQVIAQISVDQVGCERFLKLASFVFPTLLEGFHNPGGILQFYANAIFDKSGQIEEFSTRFASENFEIHHHELQFAVQLEHFVGTLRYPEGINHPGFPIWKKIQCSLFLEKGNMVFGDNMSLSNLEGSLALDPRQDPVLDLHGQLVNGNIPLALHLGGKGAVHDDRAYWLEFILNLRDQKGTQCGACLSICRPESDAIVLQLEAENLLPSQVEMLKYYFALSTPHLHHWEIQEGSFGGKLVALFEKKQLAHLELQDLVGENVTVKKGEEYYHFSSIKGEGRLFDKMQFGVDLSAPEFFALFSPELKGVFGAYRPHDHVHLSLTTQMGKEKVETSAHVEFVEAEQSLQFGYKSSTLFPSSLEQVTDGWARTEKCNHLLYGPFVRWVDEDLEVYGDIDLIAVYEGEKLDIAVQIDHFLSKSPLFDLKATSIGEKGKIHGRAKFVYDLNSQTFEGVLPLRNARAYEKKYGLNIRELDTDLFLTSTQSKAVVKHADLYFDGKKLLSDAQFHLNYHEGLSLSTLTAKLPLDTDREYLLNIVYLDLQSCEAKLFDEKVEIAHFKGERGEKWRGSLTLQTVKDPFQCTFAWDPLSNLAECEGESGAIKFHLIKRGEKLLVEKFALNDFLFQGIISKEKDHFSLSHFEIQRPNLYLAGGGNFYLDVPQKKRPLALRGELNLEVQTKTPVPLTLKTAQPFKIGYTPNLGWVFSDCELIGKEAHFKFTHFEHNSITAKSAVRHCIFDLKDELIEALLAKQLLPSFLKEFQFFKKVSGEIDGMKEKGIATFKTELNGIEPPLVLSAEATLRGGKFSLNEKGKQETLTIQTLFNQGKVEFEAINGSLFGLQADLKKWKDKKLKGSLTLDCEQFHALFDLPLTHFLTSWKTGGKTEFEGVFSPQEHLSDWGFKGKMKGIGLSCGGYPFRSFETKLDYEAGRCNFENLDLTDEVGKLWVGEGTLVRGAQQQWFFTIPLVEIRGFQPGILLKEGKKPFIIKTATIHDLRGKLDDLSSIMGEGSFHFTNLTKKGEKQQPKNLPFSTLAQMGLDAGILIPTSGEMRFTFQNRRCYFRSLDGVMSEKRRSEFQSPRNGVIGYIDFEGNLALDLQVKQHVVRSLSSPFSVKVRGTWSEPEFLIK